MKFSYPKKEEFLEALEPGYDWDRRCALVIDLIEQVLQNSPDTLYRNGSLVSQILKGYDLPGDRANPHFKTIQNCISAVGKTDGCKDYVRLGKEIYVGKDRKTGEKKYARERLWSKNAGATFKNQSHSRGDEKPRKNGNVITIDKSDISLQPKIGFAKVYLPRELVAELKER